MRKQEIGKILKEIEAGYDTIADKFSGTRKHFWRDLEFIKNYAKDRDKILDFGCGNGRLLEILPSEIDYLGVDVSQKLIDLASKSYSRENTKFLKIASSQDSLPFENDFFNAAYSIAVFHHIPSSEMRKRWAKELQRVIKPGGRVIVTVWNLWRKKYSKNILKNWLNKIMGRSGLDWNDCYIPFKDNQGNVFNRYHHAFTRKEIKKLFSRAGFEVEKCELAGKKNLLLVGKKKK